MDWIMVIGLIAATCTTAAFLPQVLKTIKLKETKDISLLMYALFTFGVIMWLIYGLLTDDLPVIIANIVTVILAAAVLSLKVKYG